MLPGVFVGYAQNAGGGWTGDLLVADWDEIEKAQNHKNIHVKRFKAAEVQTLRLGDSFRFPMRDGTLKQAGQVSRSPIHRVKPPREEAAQEEMKSLTGGLPLPPGMKLPF